METNRTSLHQTQGESLAAAQATLDRRDRPGRRRGHETSIEQAKNDTRTLPDRITGLDDKISDLTEHMDRVDRELLQAERLSTRRPQLEHQLDDTTDRLDEDRHIRTRTNRHEPNQAITDTLGPRPTRGKSARAWDHAAGTLDQHYTAHQITTGPGPTPQRQHPASYHHSHNLASTAIRSLNDLLHPPEIHRPHHGISM